MLRYLRRLADRDLALDRTMIPLGSCTMKLNATAEMIPITWPELAAHPPVRPGRDQADGYLALIAELEAMLVAITGYDAVSLQPNAGSQGELAGLLAIRAYHRSRGDDDSARLPHPVVGPRHQRRVGGHGRAGGRGGGLRRRRQRRPRRPAGQGRRRRRPRLAAVMVTYPSTHGVFEAGITELCDIVHDHGGQVYVDGANLNALVGVAQPGRFGADVSHLNLHKTFCIPHGGGGPGVGPVAVRAHLAPVPARPPAGRPAPGGVGPCRRRPYGSAGILAISWVYIALMGADGLRARHRRWPCRAPTTSPAASTPHFPVLYTGEHGDVAHECILDLRPITKATGVTVDDVAKRLMDYGFHAPTMSFPVAGTLMVEPTESEDPRELDRFCDAMLAIRAEIDRVAAGEWPADDNPLRHAPHTAEDIVADEWDRSLRAGGGGLPVPGLRVTKYFPPVGRIDAAYGDRNLICSCPPIEEYAAIVG